MWLFKVREGTRVVPEGTSGALPAVGEKTYDVNWITVLLIPIILAGVTFGLNVLMEREKLANMKELERFKLELQRQAPPRSS